jgi:hypothetical protein
MSRQALGLTQPPTQWAPAALSLWIKRLGREADHSPPTRAEEKNAWSYTSTPQYAFLALCSVKAQGQLSLRWAMGRYRMSKNPGAVLQVQFNLLCPNTLQKASVNKCPSRNTINLYSPKILEPSLHKHLTVQDAPETFERLRVFRDTLEDRLENCHKHWMSLWTILNSIFTCLKNSNSSSTWRRC